MADEEKSPEGEEAVTPAETESAASAETETPVSERSDAAGEDPATEDDPAAEDDSAAEEDDSRVSAAAVTQPSAGVGAIAAAAVAHDHDDEIGHVTPMVLLAGVLGALLLLTILTVAVTSLDLGSQGNFVVAMIIATIKAALVMGYFMHLVWDSKFNVVVFLSSFLFVLLFLSMAVLDRSEYRPNVQLFESDKAQAAE